MKASLQLKTSQQLKLTPDLQQSLRLLQLSAPELLQEIQEQLDANPLLEIDEVTDPFETLVEAEGSKNIESAEIKLDFETQSRTLQADEEWDAPSESIDSTNYSLNSNQVSHSLGETYRETDGLENIAGESTLSEHLLSQVSFCRLNPLDQQIVETLIHNIDHDGYLTISIARAAETIEADINPAEIQAMLSLIQSFDPAGVGARSLAERLELILKRTHHSNPHYPTAHTIITQHLELLAKKNVAQLKKVLTISEPDLRSAIELITSISPRITGEFSTHRVDQITPDVLVSLQQGKAHAFINPANQHRLKLNDEYIALLKKPLDPASDEYLRDKLQQAKAFVKGVMSRYDTLLLVAQAIVDRQQDFFRVGPQAMAPMTLADIADYLQLHESTISRATAGKYLQSNRGTFELKYFFSSALNSVAGENVSATAIRDIIRQLITQENKNKPLSDAKLEKQLAAKGYSVARRTVAKYRESMGFLSSSQRKSL